MNEVEGCQRDVPRLEREHFEEIYAVDGGSSDGTVEYLHSQQVPVYGQEHPGLNSAYLSAFGHCSTDALILFHPKGTIDPKAALKFRPHLEDGYDLVIASRIVPGGTNEEDSHVLRPRKWFVMGLAVAAQILWKREGNMIWDVLHGCRAMRKDAFFAIDPLHQGLSIDLEMVIRSYRKGLKRIEFPVHEGPRPFGKTHFRAFPTGPRVLQYVLQELRRPV